MITTAVISILTPSVGRATLAQTVNGLRHQTFADWEQIIVLNNGAQRIPVGDERVRWVEGGDLPTDYGSTARKRALESISGQYVATLDDDDWYEPAFLETMLAEIGESDILYCRTNLWRKGDDVKLGSWFVPFDAVLLRRGNFITSNSLIAKREVFEQVPIHPEIGHDSDWHWLMEASRKGFIIRGIDQPLSNARVEGRIWDYWGRSAGYGFTQS